VILAALCAAQYTSGYGIAASRFSR
jgi:hypothetical protein